MKHLVRLIGFIIAIIAFRIFGIKPYNQIVDLEGHVNNETNIKFWALAIVNIFDISALVGPRPDFMDVVLCGIANLISLLALLYTFYGILSVLGIDKDNKPARKEKALFGYLGISILAILAEYI